MRVQAGVGKLSPSEILDEYRCCYSKDMRNMNKNIQLLIKRLVLCKTNSQSSSQERRKKITNFVIKTFLFKINSSHHYMNH
jgi:hypothetical protein